MSADERDELVRPRRQRRVLRMERDLLTRTVAFFAAENVLPRKRRASSSMRALASFPVACERLGVSHAGYSAWCARRATPTLRMVADVELTAMIRTVHAA